VPHFIVNIVGGLPMPGRDTLVEGVVYDLDPEEMWVARAIYLRHLVETDEVGIPLSSAPPAGERTPRRLEEINLLMDEDGFADEWLFD